MSDMEELKKLAKQGRATAFNTFILMVEATAPKCANEEYRDEEKLDAELAPVFSLVEQLEEEISKSEKKRWQEYTNPENSVPDKVNEAFADLVIIALNKVQTIYPFTKDEAQQIGWATKKSSSDLTKPSLLVCFNKQLSLISGYIAIQFFANLILTQSKTPLKHLNIAAQLLFKDKKSLTEYVRALQAKQPRLLPQEVMVMIDVQSEIQLKILQIISKIEGHPSHN